MDLLWRSKQRARLAVTTAAVASAVALTALSGAAAHPTSADEFVAAPAAAHGGSQETPPQRLLERYEDTHVLKETAYRQALGRFLRTYRLTTRDGETSAFATSSTDFHRGMFVEHIAISYLQGLLIARIRHTDHTRFSRGEIFEGTGIYRGVEGTVRLRNVDKGPDVLRLRYHF